MKKIAPRKIDNLHGGLPSRSKIALLLIDVINDLKFPGGEKFARRLRPLAKNISALQERARRANIPVIYANDNFKKWRSDFRKIIEHCTQGGIPGRVLAQTLMPEIEDYFILKPEKSAFYQTPLALLLGHLEVETLILAGLTTDLCVYLTASDAHMQDYKLFIPRDCVAAINPRDHAFFLKQMEKNFHADLKSSRKIRL